MKKRFLTLLCIPFLLIGCGQNNNDDDNGSYNERSIVEPRHSGEIGSFSLLTPENGYSGSSNFVFTWQEASNSDYYQLEIANNINFVNEDETEDVYVRESNITRTQFSLSYSLDKKDILYYWRVTAVNKDHTKKCEAVGNFFYESVKVSEIPIKIEDAQDWVLHKEGSYADISIDRSNFFGNGQNSLAIVFDKEHTMQEPAEEHASSNGWIVVTKAEDRELYGTDSFYFNFYYSGHDATVLVRVLDYDGEYWHKQVQIANNSKQTILMKYDEFELRTAGTNIMNRVFDWQHIRYFEIVFERTFGDGVCLFSDIKAVRFEDYKDMFVDKMDFRMSDPKDWTYENYDFRNDMIISEDGSELTLVYNARNAETNPDGFNAFGFQNVNVYKYFVNGDALKMKVKYTGSSTNAKFYFRILEEDSDRWQFKTPFTYFIKDDYKELIIPLKAFQRTDYMTGDGAKQFYFIQKLNIGLADNYATGTLSIKDLEVISIKDLFPEPAEGEDPIIVPGVGLARRTIGEDGCIDNFNNYNIYTEMYYYWQQSVVNKDEAMKLDDTHKAGGGTNTYCAEFDYKADMEMATYQLYMDTKAVKGKNAFSIWLKDASVKFDDPAVSYLDDKDVAAEMTIQLTMDSGEWYRYVIDKVEKEWHNYTILFSDFTLNNGDTLYNDPKPLDSEHIVHIAFGFKYLYYDQQGNHHPTYAIANPVYLDEIYFKSATETSIVEIDSTIKEDEDNPNRITIETLEKYSNDQAIFDYWSYMQERDYNEMALSTDVSSQGGTKSLRMHYKGYDSISYGRTTQFANSITAKGFCIDMKGDGKATVYLNLNWRSGTTLMKMRYTVTNLPTTWTHYEIGFELFKDVNGSSKTISANYAKNIESVSFGIVNNDYSASDIYIDNMRLLKNINYTTNTRTAIE